MTEKFLPSSLSDMPPRRVHQEEEEELEETRGIAQLNINDREFPQNITMSAPPLCALCNDVSSQEPSIDTLCTICWRPFCPQCTVEIDPEAHYGREQWCRACAEKRAVGLWDELVKHRDDYYQRMRAFADKHPDWEGY